MSDGETQGYEMTRKMHIERACFRVILHFLSDTTAETTSAAREAIENQWRIYGRRYKSRTYGLYTTDITIDERLSLLHAQDRYEWAILLTEAWHDDCFLALKTFSPFRDRFVATHTVSNRMNVGGWHPVPNGVELQIMDFVHTHWSGAFFEDDEFFCIMPKLDTHETCVYKLPRRY